MNTDPQHAASIFEHWQQTGEKPDGFHIDMDAVAAKYLLECKRSAAIDRWLDACPPELRETDWADARLAPWKAQHDAVIGWKNSGRGIVLSGPTGRGKSRCAWALMRRLADEGREVRYFHSAEWFARLQQFLQWGRDDSEGWLKALARCPVVYIDDFGQEAIQSSRAEWAAGSFFRFLDLRHGNGLPLFITTNLGAQEMAGTTKGADVRRDPLVRRLLEMCEVVKF